MTSHLHLMTSFSARTLAFKFYLACLEYQTMQLFLSPSYLTWINRCTASCGDWLIDCWGAAVLALLTAPSVPSVQLFCPLVSVQNHVNRCSTVHRWLLSGCLSKNHLIWFGRELDPPTTNSPLLHADTWAQWLSCSLLWHWHQLGLFSAGLQ